MTGVKRMANYFIRCIIILLFLNSCATTNSPDLETLAINAVKSRWPNYGQEFFFVDQTYIPYFTSVTVYRIEFRGCEPSFFYNVVIDSDNTVYLFLSNNDAAEFNALIGRQNITLNKVNILHHVDAYLRLVDNGLQIVNSMDDIKKKASYFQNIDQFIHDSISPMKLTFNQDTIEARFHSWGRRLHLKRWHMIISYEGKILHSSFQSLFGPF